MQKILKYIMKLMMWSIYPIGFLIKRDKSIWLFGSYSGFTDNSRYLFESTTITNIVLKVYIFVILQRCIYIQIMYQR